MIILIYISFIPLSWYTMDNKENPPKVDNQEWFNRSAEEIKSNTNITLMESLDMDKEKILKQLEAAKNAEDRVKLFAKRADLFWIEALIWLFEGIWDFTPAIICTCYLLAEWIHIWLSWKDCLKILWYQTADVLIGMIPWIWDVADFFFRSNRYSSTIFSEHLNKLKQEALERGVPIEEIHAISQKETRFVNTMDRYINYRSKNKDKIKKKKKK